MDATDRSLPKTDRATTGRATDRATVSSVGVALLVLTAVGLSATVGAAALSATPPENPTSAAFDLRVDDGTIAVTHLGGEVVDVRDLRVVVSVDGESLRYQPPVPFFSAQGFRSGPTGPFNLASDPLWTTGETATVGVAGTNQPRVDPGDSVELALYDGSHRLAVLRGMAT